MKKIISLIVLISLSGCSLFTGELYLGTRRIDSYESKQKQVDRPMKCLFVECPTNQNHEIKGS